MPSASRAWGKRGRMRAHPAEIARASKFLSPDLTSLPKGVVAEVASEFGLADGEPRHRLRLLHGAHRAHGRIASALLRTRKMRFGNSRRARSSPPPSAPRSGSRKVPYKSPAR